jgi:WD40 repeat protein
MFARRTGLAALTGFVLCLAVSIALPSRASAVLVYERPASHTIVVARDDGTQPKVLGHGQRPVVAPDGRKVAFLARVRRGHGDLRVRQLNSSRSVLLAHSISTLSPVVWSPDSRYLVARGDRRDDAILLDVKRRKRRSFPDSSYAGASFAPDSSRVAFASLQSSGGTLYIADVHSGRTRAVADGFSPAWGTAGIAYAGDIGEVDLKRSPRARQRVLLVDRGRDLLPLAWASRAPRLLVRELLTDGGFRALVIDAETRAVSEAAHTFSSVDGIASHGHVILAELGGNVVAAKEDGTLRTLATGARAASWTK